MNDNLQQNSWFHTESCDQICKKYFSDLSCWVIFFVFLNEKNISPRLSEGVILISSDGIFSQVWWLIDLSDMRGRQTRESCRATDDLRLCVEAAGVAILAELVACAAPSSGATICSLMRRCIYLQACSSEMVMRHLVVSLRPRWAYRQCAGVSSDKQWERKSSWRFFNRDIYIIKM